MSRIITDTKKTVPQHSRVEFRTWGASLALVASAAAPFLFYCQHSAQAQDADPAMRTEKARSDIETKGAMKDEIFGVKPQVGVMLFKPGPSRFKGDVDSRGMVGVTVDLNIFRLVEEDWRRFYGGLSTGVLASHVGASGANFVGLGDAGGGGNLLVIPMNLKLGYNVNEAFRVSMRGGANWIYRSVGNQFNLGDQGKTTSSDWTPYPNVGMDFEFGNQVALLVRPDFTLTPEDEIFTGTLALSIPLG